MILLLRPVIRLVSILWLLALALCGLGIALYCFDALVGLGAARPDRLVHLVRVEHSVRDFLRQLAASGPVAGLSLLCGLGAMALGALLLLGSLLPARERTAQLERGEHGTLAVQRAVLRKMIRALAEPARGVTAVSRPRLVLSRRGTGGRLSVAVTATRTSDQVETEQAVAAAIRPLTAPFALRERVSVTRGERGERVE